MLLTEFTGHSMSIGSALFTKGRHNNKIKNNRFIEPSVTFSNLRLPSRP